MLQFCPLSWQSGDIDDDDGSTHCYIMIFGRTIDGRSVCVRLLWHPRFFLQSPVLASARSTLLDQFPRRNKQLSVTVHRTPIYGFCDGRVDTFIQLTFDSEKACRSARYLCERTLHKPTWEASVDSVAQFMHEADIRPMSWLEVSGGQQLGVNSRTTSCLVEVVVDSPRCIQQARQPPDAPVPWVLASWDLETYSPDGKFPKANKKEYPIIQIGVTFAKGSLKDCERFVITSTDCDAVEGVNIVVCDGEIAAIKAFMQLLHDKDADILIAWNGSGFDNRYLYGRSVFHDMDDKISMGKVKRERLSLDLREADTGDQPVFFRAAGVLQYDPMLHLRKENRFDSYKLDVVASAVTGHHKVDLPYSQLFELHRQGTSAGQATIAQYCSVDCELPLQIMAKLSLLPNIFALANATRTPANAIVTRGQVIQLCTFSPHPQPILCLCVVHPWLQTYVF